MYVVCSMYVVICKIDHCIHIHGCIPMGLGHNDPWVESHMWPQQMWGQRSSRGQWPLVQVFAKRVTVSTYFDVRFMGLGHNDPWVESHMWHQQMWGQRSSRGQWPFSHLNRYGVISNITMIAQVCDRESSRDSWSRTALFWEDAGWKKVDLINMLKLDLFGSNPLKIPSFTTFWQKVDLLSGGGPEVHCTPHSLSTGLGTLAITEAPKYDHLGTTA